MKGPRVAIVGAGISGLSCASELSENGFEVTVFDKSRSTGGRLASTKNDGNSFDVGAQYFTARDVRFKKFLSRLVLLGTASAWHGKFGRASNGCITEEQKRESRYVGVPLMRSIADEMSGKAVCLVSHRVRHVDRVGDKWSVTGTRHRASGIEEFKRDEYDFLVLSLPSPQAAELHPHPNLGSQSFHACLALMIAFNDRLPLNFDGVSLDDAVISWVARDSSKPGRPPGERWVIQAAAGWSEKHFDDGKDLIELRLTEQFATILDISLPLRQFAIMHKWRYAAPVNPQSAGCIFDGDLNLAYCGDWCQGARVESAFLSGLSVAARIMEQYRRC